MPNLTDYAHYDGRHHETGPIHNALAYQGVTAPHTGAPLSEALLMGLSGGAAFGYFTFEYEGYSPHIALLTRNTFDPLETLYDRLALPRENLETASADKGLQNLHEALESGRPVLVWADAFSLKYNAIPWDDHNWHVTTVLVVGIDGDEAILADRAAVPIRVPVAELQAARGRIKKNRFRVLTLDAPDLERLPGAVSKAIWSCISLFTEASPRGKRGSFGLAALQSWSKLLTNTRSKQGWARYFPPGERLWMALAGNTTQSGAYGWIKQGAANSAERGMYADFLDEAAAILSKPSLKGAAEAFRAAEREWTRLTALLLPGDVPLLHEAANLLDRRRSAFIEQGAEALLTMHEINERLNALHAQASENFPISADDVGEFYAGLAAQVDTIHTAEQDAVDQLQAAMR